MTLWLSPVRQRRGLPRASPQLAAHPFLLQEKSQTNAGLQSVLAHLVYMEMCKVVRELLL